MLQSLSTRVYYSYKTIGSRSIFMRLFKTLAVCTISTHSYYKEFLCIANCTNPPVHTDEYKNQSI